MIPPSVINSSRLLEPPDDARSSILDPLDWLGLVEFAGSLFLSRDRGKKRAIREMV
jgi:hypothetical protein